MKKQKVSIEIDTIHAENLNIMIKDDNEAKKEKGEFIPNILNIFSNLISKLK